MGAEHSGKDRHQTERQQHDVATSDQRHGLLGLKGDTTRKPFVQEQRLEDEEDQGEDQPDRDQGMHPPECRIEKSVPSRHQMRHVEPGQACQRHGYFRLPGKRAFDLLEQSSAVFGRRQMAHARQQDEGDK